MSLLRRLKLVYWMNNLWNHRQLKCNEDIYKKYGIYKSPTSLLSSKDFTIPTTDIPWLDQPVITDAEIQVKEGFNGFSTQAKENILAWPKNGYMQLSSFYTPAEIDVINEEIEQIKLNKSANYRLDERIIFAIHQSEKIYELATKKALTDILSFTLGKRVKLFQSLNFEKGSQQLAHSDTIHMTTYPLGYLIAVWMALEDVSADSGPLFYYPGSHRLPYILNKDYNPGGNYFLLGKDAYKKYEQAVQAVIESNGLKKEIFTPKKGDILIWHANLLHGGTMINNPDLSRKSMVLHFYCEDVICYHEITQRPAIYNGKEAHCPG